MTQQRRFIILFFDERKTRATTEPTNRPSPLAIIITPRENRAFVLPVQPGLKSVLVPAQLGRSSEWPEQIRASWIKHAFRRVGCPVSYSSDVVASLFCIIKCVVSNCTTNSQRQTRSCHNVSRWNLCVSTRKLPFSAAPRLNFSVMYEHFHYLKLEHVLTRDSIKR